MRNRKDLEPYINLDALEEIIYESIRDALENSDFINNRKPLFFSITMKIEPDGKAIVESFGNMASLSKMSSSAERKQREVFAEVIESEKDYLITMELPFANESDLAIKISDNKLVVSGSQPECFYKQVVFDMAVLPDKVQKFFKNGVLEIVVPKKI